MGALKCDICGGSLVVQPGGKMGQCEYCGALYSLERMREKVQEIKGTVKITGEVQARQTGTTSDIQQWKILLKKYMAAMDYSAAMPICKKILEAAPTDEEANKAYDTLQQLQYMDIRNGVLVKYTGKATKVVIPEGVTEIGETAFGSTPVAEVEIPNSVTEIGSQAFANTSLVEIKLPSGVTTIKNDTFAYTPLAKIEIPNSVTYIGNGSFAYTQLTHIVIPTGVKRIEARAFANTALESVDIPFGTEVDPTAFSGSPVEKKLHKQWRESGLCPRCGGTVKGLFTKTCVCCGYKF